MSEIRVDTIVDSSNSGPVEFPYGITLGSGFQLNVGYASTSGISTVSEGLINSPSINVTNINASGVSTFVGEIDAVDANFTGNVTIGGTLTYEDVTNIDSIGIITARSDVKVGGNFSSVGISTIASSGGITTTGGDLYVGGNLEVAGTSEFIGSATFRGGTINLGDSSNDDVVVGGEFASNLVPTSDNLYDLGSSGKKWKDLYLSGSADVNQLNVSGLSTFSNLIDANGGLNLVGGSTFDNINVTGVSTLSNVTVGGATTELLVNGDARVTGILTVGSGTITFDGTNNTIGVGTVTLTEQILSGLNDLSSQNAYFTGNLEVAGIVTATSFVKSGGTSSQFLKADGSVDSNTYLTTETQTLDDVTSLGNSTSNGISVGVLTATSIKKSGGTSSQFLKADGSIDSSTYLTSYTETQTLDDVTSLGNITTNGISVGVATATSFVKNGGTSSQFLKADGTVDSSTYLTSYTETQTLNDVTSLGNSTSNGISVGVLTATSIKKSGGTSSQFLKADGSVDSNTYLTTETQTLNDVTSLGNSTSNGISVGVLTATSIDATTISGNLNNTLTLSTSGTGLSGSATYNNSGASTFTVSSNATDVNTSSTIVARNASGNFSAGTITANLTGVASTATKLETARDFSITGSFVTASAVSFDGTGNVALGATITPDSITLGTYTSGDYVESITGTANEVEVTGGSGEGSTPQIGLPANVTISNDLVVNRDIQINRDLYVTGNVSVGGTSAQLFTQSLRISDSDLVIGIRTDSFGEDISTDSTANHGGVAIASTEGSPLVDLFIAGIETAPATYKKIMWFKSGTFSGLGTDAWLANYAVGIGSTQFPTGTRLAAGSVQFTENDLAVVRNINASGVATATSFVKSGGTSSQFLKADGTVDSSTYLTSYTETQTLDDVTSLGNSTSNGISVGVATATSFVKNGGTSSQFLKADGSIDSSTYLTSYTETQTLNDVTSLGNITTNGISVGVLTATSIKKSGGTSSQFLKADGSVDTSTYLTSYTETQTLDDVTSLGNITTNGISVGVATATSFVKNGGTSSQFLKADGSVDSSTYLTSYTETQTLDDVTSLGNSTSNGISVGVLTATSFSGSGSNITGISTTNIIDYGVGIGGGEFVKEGACGTIHSSEAGTGGGGPHNFFVGRDAGFYNSVTGRNNNFLGRVAGFYNCTGSNNNFIGDTAGYYNTTGSDNTFIGDTSGFYNTTGCYNFFVGDWAGFCNTTGCYNTFLGNRAGQGGTGGLTGKYNNFFGRYAGRCNTSGGENNFFGLRAGYYNTTGRGNNFMGIYSGYCNTSGINNNIFGYLGGYYNTTGTGNNFFGSQAGYCNSTGCYNNFFGGAAGRFNSTGGCNNFFGFQAGWCHKTGSHNNFFGCDAGRGGSVGGGCGSYNNFFGNKAGYSNTTGQSNFFVGSYSGYSNTSAINNNFLGSFTGYYTTTGSNNNFIGGDAGYFNCTGCFNNFIGFSAGFYNTTGRYNNFLGSNAGRCNTTGCHNTFLGQCAGHGGTGGVTGGCNIAIGQNAGKCLTSGVNNTFLGQCAGLNTLGGSYNTFIGSFAGICNTTGWHNNFLGGGAGQYNTTGSANNFFGEYAGNCNNGSYNNFFGSLAGYQNTSGSNNNFSGFRAGYCNKIGCHNTFLGQCAGHGGTGGVTGGCNTAIGQNAGKCLTSGFNNNFLGQYAGRCNTTGCNNNFFGSEAGFNNTGSHNAFIGQRAGYCVTSGCRNVFIGCCASSGGSTVNTASDNISIGAHAGRNITTGGCNIFLGCQAGNSNTTGRWNHFFGYLAGYCNTEGRYNNFIGLLAGQYNTTGCNNIAIGCQSGTPTGGLCTLTDGSNVIIMGNSNHSCARIQIAWTTGSDIRDKCVYGDVPYGKAFLQGVNPIKYGFKDRETGELKDDKKRYGFSAQEIASLEDEPIIVDNPDGENLGLTHDYLLPVLVNAIKELDAENRELKERLSALEERVNNLS